MSLDIYLYGPLTTVTETCRCQCGHEHQSEKTYQPAYYSKNITHNLGPMAHAAGLYIPLWRPETCGVKTAKDLIEPLTRGLAALRSDPEKYIAMEPDNKWGTYRDFLPWLEELLLACKEYPDAEVEACR
jgi:hypothetical protein